MREAVELERGFLGYRQSGRACWLSGGRGRCLYEHISWGVLVSCYQWAKRPVRRTHLMRRYEGAYLVWTRIPPGTVRIAGHWQYCYTLPVVLWGRYSRSGYISPPVSARQYISDRRDASVGHMTTHLYSVPLDNSTFRQCPLTISQLGNRLLRILGSVQP